MCCITYFPHCISIIQDGMGPHGSNVPNYDFQDMYLLSTTQLSPCMTPWEQTGCAGEPNVP